MLPPRLPRAAAIALVLLAPAFARAEPHPSVDARQRYAQGAAAFGKGDFAAAVDAFADVYRTTGETKHLWNLALAEVEAGRPFDALTHLRLYVSKPDANPKNVERARGLITDAASKIGHVTVIAPDGADVLLDGSRIGTAPLTSPLDVDPATPHVIIAQRGEDTVKQVLTPTGAATLHISLAFPVAPPAAPPPAPAVATAPPAPPASPSAASAPPAAAPSPQEEDHGGGSGLRVGLTIGLGVGALAALGAGIAMGVASNNDYNGAQQLTSQMQPGACVNPNAAGCSQLSQDRSSQESAHTTSIVLYAGAGVLAAGAIAAFLFVPHGRAAETRGSLVPIVGAGVVGAGYVGAF